MPGALLRSDNLQSLSPQDIRLLVDQEKVEVVLDLRTTREVELEGPGPITHEARVRIDHHSLHPRSGGNTDLDASTVDLWPQNDSGAWSDEPRIVQAYMSYVPIVPIRSWPRYGRSPMLAAPCWSTARRARTSGMVVALALDAAGVDRRTIVNDYLVTTERIEAIMERLTSSPTYRAELEGHDPQRHAPVPGTLERVFELIDDGFGGSAAWLSSHGLSEADLALLRRRLAPITGDA